jgi:hypothetical protein
VDGQPLSAEGQLRSGLHLLQIPSTAGLRSAWLTIDGEAWVVIPGNYRPPILGRLLESGQEEAPAALVLLPSKGRLQVKPGGGRSAARLALLLVLLELSPPTCPAEHTCSTPLLAPCTMAFTRRQNAPEERGRAAAVGALAVSLHAPGVEEEKMSGRVPPLARGC